MRMHYDSSPPPPHLAIRGVVSLEQLSVCSPPPHLNKLT